MNSVIGYPPLGVLLEKAVPGPGAAAKKDHRIGPVGPWRATLAALSANLVGIGLARFAYTPLIPALVDAGWFSPADAAYLGAANLAGYLAGALLAGRMAAFGGAPDVVRAMMVLATAAFFACAVPLSYSWFFAWRFAAGIAGGALMALAAPAVLAHLPRARQGLAGGVIFTGVGLGIAASGTVVPVMIRVGLVETWLCLGALALLLTVFAWGSWPPRARRDRPPPEKPVRGWRSGGGLASLYLVYGLNAVGLVPHMVFLVDFVARGLGAGLDFGAGYWVLFGLGAVCGPVLAGHLGDRIGFRRALRLALLVQAVAIGLLAVSDAVVGLIISSVVVGGFVPGIVVVVLGRIRELVPEQSDRQRAAWSLATTAFALGQAAGAYGLSFIFDRTGSYVLLFALGAAALLLALTINLAAGGGQSSRPAAPNP